MATAGYDLWKKKCKDYKQRSDLPRLNVKQDDRLQIRRRAEAELKSTTLAMHQKMTNGGIKMKLFN